ncbi:aminotransferase class I/II-fold pyridoxal phosphate-dependent enzyme, partial [Candidatus Pelagibacter sp.]|uniref:aminotransferase class I/II-fold pyridoxal phosphate-dependent enzyme n=1 Tax=Candidatus Pelagibacter sp. TaxID=2024849 RepID=UPI003F826E11
MIPQWNKEFDLNKISFELKKNLKKRHISQGKITENFQRKISKFLKVKYVVAVPNGTIGLLVALKALNLKKGDEIIISDRAWISVLNAIKFLNLKPIFVDVEKDRPVIDVKKITKKITKKTKVIIPVHMGGRGCNIDEIKKIIGKKKIFILEDAAQAFGSKVNKRFLGTTSDIGCFSMSIAKTISSGQGGFIVTNNQKIHNRILKIKNNGLKDIKNIFKWGELGLNFKFNDILATMAISEIERFNFYKNKLISLYKTYSKNLKSKKVHLIEADIENGEIPQYIEILALNRKKLLSYLKKKKIDVRIFYPSMSESKLIGLKSFADLNNSKKFSKFGLYLPSGPNQKLKDINYVINKINS